jgi:transglutaminase-like putative cysteine protease
MSENVLEIVCELANWIGINVKSKTIDVPRYPGETLKSRLGDCDDKANLLITMCRILGIPSFLQVGCIYGPSRTETAWENHLTAIYNSVSFHAWAIIYIPPWG